MSRREDLRREYVGNLCAVLQTFVFAGHEVHIRTEHGRAATDNRIIFDIPDWAAFADLLEDVGAAAH